MTLLLRRETPARPAAPPTRGTTPTLLVILAVQLMVVFDVSIAITALPDIRRDMGFSPGDLSWVQNAYTLTFGGLLLLGSRIGDLYGRRRALLGGLAVFTVASAAAGLAQSPAELLGARALQGAGAAVAAPSVLALLTTTFTGAAERARAIALFAAVSSAGGSVGLLLGGVLTDLISWRMGLLVNVPIGLALLVAVPRVLGETPPRPGRFDLPGAITSTLGMGALVFGFERSASLGWGSATVIGSFVTAAVLLSTFVAVERRAEQPITPLRLFADRRRSGAYVVRMLLVGSNFSAFFFLTQYLQGTQGLSPLQAGVAFLPMTATMFAFSRLSPAAVRRTSERATLLGGVVLTAASMVTLSLLTGGDATAIGLAPAMALFGVGMGLALPPLTQEGIRGVAPEDAGAGSGLVNAAHQLGGSVGLGILVTVFSAADGSGLADGVAAALSGSSVMLALAVATIAVVMRPATGRTAAALQAAAVRIGVGR